jgi:hypothetical protein
VEFRDQPIDAALEGWNELCSAVAAASTKSGGRLKYRHPEDFGVLIQVEEPPRALRLEYSPELKKLRYNTGISGWQELHVVKESTRLCLRRRMANEKRALFGPLQRKIGACRYLRANTSAARTSGFFVRALRLTRRITASQNPAALKEQGRRRGTRDSFLGDHIASLSNESR